MKYLALLFGLLILSGCNSFDKEEALNELKAQIQMELDELEGDFAVAYQDLEMKGQTVLINENERFHAASTMKTPVLIELYRRAELGEFSVQDSILIKNEFRSIVDGSTFAMQVNEDSEQDLYNNLNKNTTLYKLAYEMITRSSNLATNILIDFLDAKKVTATMRTLGADSIEVLRGVEDLKAYRQGLSNSTTAKDLLVMFEHLGSDTLISKSANEEMIQILNDQKFNDMIPAQLPEGTKVAHKTGWITNVHHDSGIVFTPEGKGYVMVFLSKNAPDRKAVQEKAAIISRLIYEHTLKLH